MRQRGFLSGDEFATLLAGWLLLPILTLALRFWGVAAVRAWRLPAKPRPRPLPAERIARLVEAAARYQPWPARCLARSVLLERLLLREGIPCALRIGCRHTADGLEAHAWVEHQGLPLNDTADVATRFPPFPEWPAAGRHRTS